MIVGMNSIAGVVLFFSQLPIVRWRFHARSRRLPAAHTGHEQAMSWP
jgi:hypothetical protein